MDCPKCGRSFEKGDAICGGCDFILDTSFLGDGFIDDEESKRFNAAPGKAEPSPWSDDLGGDSLILGNLSDHVAMFRTNDSGMEDKLRGMQLYVGSAIQAMLSPHAVPVVQSSALSESVRLNPFERHVLALADGSLPVGGIFQQSGLNREELYTALATLTDKGYLKLRDENTVVASAPSFLADEESDSEAGDANVTLVSEMGDELRKLRESVSDGENANEDLFAGDSGVFADEDSGAELHRVEEAEEGATIAEPAPMPSAEDLPSNQAEERALAFADELISEERTNVQEMRPLSRNVGSRSGSGRARRPPPPLPKREEAERRHAEMAASALPSDPSGGWLVESNPPDESPAASPMISEELDGARATDGARENAVASVPEDLHGLSVNLSSVFDAGPSDAVAAAAPELPEDDDVFASSQSVADEEAAKIEGEVFVPAVPVPLAERENEATGLVEGAFAEEFPSAVATMDSQEEVAPAQDVDEAPAAATDAPSTASPRPDVLPSASSANQAPSELMPLPGAGGAPGAAAVFDNVFATGAPVEGVRPAARLDNVAEEKSAAPAVVASAQPVAPIPVPAPAPAPAPSAVVTEVPPSVARKPPPANVVSFEYRRKAEKIFEEAEADFAAGRVGSARMNAKLASIYNPHEPRYSETLKRWEEISVASASPVEPAASPNQRLVENAKRAERQGHYEEAVRLLRQALENDPNAAPLLNHLGVILATRLQQYQEASTAIMRAIELNPQNLAYKNNLGKILARQAENDDANGMKGMGGLSRQGGAVMVKNIRPKIF